MHQNHARPLLKRNFMNSPSRLFDSAAGQSLFVGHAEKSHFNRGKRGTNPIGRKARHKKSSFWRTVKIRLPEKDKEIKR